MILFKEVDHFTYDTTGSGCTRCHCYTFLALQPLSLELGKILNMVVPSARADRRYCPETELEKEIILALREPCFKEFFLP